MSFGGFGSSGNRPPFQLYVGVDHKLRALRACDFSHPYGIFRAAFGGAASAFGSTTPAFGASPTASPFGAQPGASSLPHPDTQVFKTSHLVTSSVRTRALILGLDSEFKRFPAVRFQASSSPFGAANTAGAFGQVVCFVSPCQLVCRVYELLRPICQCNEC
jgi:hypothetical protein